MGNKPTTIISNIPGIPGKKTDQQQRESYPPTTTTPPQAQASQTAIQTTPTQTIPTASTPIAAAAAPSATSVNPQHQYEKPRRRGSQISESQCSSSSVASSSSASSTAEKPAAAVVATPTATKKKKQSRKKKINTVASKETITPPPAAKATPLKEQTVEKAPTVEEDKAPAVEPGLGRRKRYKSLSKSKLTSKEEKEDNTEFERIAKPSRPAASKKHAAGAKKNNIERLMVAASTPVKAENEELVSLKESEEEQLKSAQDIASDSGTALSSAKDNNNAAGKSKEKIEQKEEVKANESSSDPSNPSKPSVAPAAVSAPETPLPNVTPAAAATTANTDDKK